MNLIEKIDAYINEDLDSLFERGHNPWHNSDGEFANQDDISQGSYVKTWDGEDRKSEVDGGEISGPAERPCGREARARGGNVRCQDGKVIWEPS